jgi:type VI secretion system protein ImpC
MLWGHPALIPALLLAETFGQQGAKMKLGTVMTVGDIPYYIITDADGDQMALPCTERMYSERQAVMTGNYSVMPLLSIRGRPELRLGSFASLLGTPIAGFWAPVSVTSKPAAAAPPVAAALPPVAVAIDDAPAESEAPAAEETPEEDTSDLDALLASLGGGGDAAAEAEPAEEAAAAEPVAGEAPMDDLDALLASLNADPAPPAADETEPDLDALLASLK